MGTKFQTRIAALGAEPDPATVKTEVLQTPFEDRVFQYELTLNDYEGIIDPLLANHLDLNSVNEIDTLPFNDDNIIYPILDALAKAKEKLGVLPQIDAVLLNGGMTKLRVIRKRLEVFFGPDIQILEAGDPDKAVSLGAAYYHYDVASGTSRYQNKPRILPDTIGLEITGGEVIPLVEAGTTLPSSPTLYDKLEAKAGANHIELPFYSGRRRDTKPPNRKLLVQKVPFGKPLLKDEPVMIKMQVDEKGILNVDGWLKTEPHQKFTATVGSTQQETAPAAGEKEEKQSPSVPHREVSTLNVKHELRTLKAKFSNYLRQYDNFQQRAIMDQITNQETKIVGADNAEDFIAPLIQSVRSYHERFGKQRMTILLGMLAAKPQKNSGNSLHDIYDVAMEMSNPADVSKKEAAYVNSVITQAIVTIGKTKLPSAEGHLLLFLDENMPISVRQNAIYAIGKCCQGINVVKHLQPLIESQNDSVRIAVNWALGKIGRRERENPLPITELNSVISQLSTKLWGEPHDQAKQNNVYALGEICDRRSRDLTECVTDQTAGQVLELLGTFQNSEIGTSLSDLGRIRTIAPLQQRANLAIRMIKGEKLSAEEERSLLKIREDD
ncbi:MAG: Hsp70 family protein [Candidatus Poribacteria bacterium]|nr:Hsp70 family protein [Candidatus Poribacteria bacterium]